MLWEAGKAGRLQGWEAFAPGALLSQHFDKAGAKGRDLSGSGLGQFPLCLRWEKAGANYPCGFKVPLPYIPLKLRFWWELFAVENVIVRWWKEILCGVSSQFFPFLGFSSHLAPS